MTNDLFFPIVLMAFIAGMIFDFVITKLITFSNTDMEEAYQKGKEKSQKNQEWEEIENENKNGRF